jgi:hypothetical protein
MAADPRRLVVVQEALKAAALEALAVMDRGEVIRQTIAAVATSDLTPRELTLADRQARKVAMVAEVRRLERLGNGRSVPMLAARKFADPRDPVELASVARQIRRLRKKSGPCPNRAPEID